MNDLKIRKLSTLVDRLAFNRAGAWSSISSELVAVRSMVLQNRLSLDILLKKEGRMSNFTSAAMLYLYPM